ncbi:hypothetical protein LOTGIDRAFT_237756 [Lottia gigantea]|uniref:PLAC domain-containing protein n=1 Tax=Lottia gigantea TaxID=225164 RepID=V4CLZ4_LOTGI|nr:hypothetical protein LOTGIDRAFT_237756 [Lottia gigantea]ESP03330.1 hypothetical protein LOTGIDRAFT_237756 [Lottia gigantea]
MAAFSGQNGEKRSRDGWGPWTDWSICSTSCGPGLVYSQRTCHRLDGRNSCPGHSKRYKTCNFGDCPNLPEDPTIEECKRQNRQYYGGKRFYWEPYINPRTPCELSCKAKGHHYIYNIKRLAKDGTDCSVKQKGVCLAGRCMKVGCDGIIGSGTKLDRCGICNGNGNSCRLVAGVYTKSPRSKFGYNHIVTIPKDARSVNISELTRSRNFLAVKSGGKYYINGNRRLHRTGNYQIAGTTFIYSRRDGVGCPGECLTADGPTNQTVDIEVLYYHKNPGIKYQYSLRHKTLADYRGIDSTGPGIPLAKPVHGASPAINSIPEEGIPLSKPYVPPGGVPLANPVYDSGPFIRKSSDNRLIIRNRAGHGEIIKNNYGKQYPFYIPNKVQSSLNSELHTSVSGGYPNKQAVRSSYGSKPINQTVTSNDVGESILFNSIQETNSIYNNVHEDGSVYSWSISGFTECSQPCGGGVQETKIICLKGKSKVVVTEDNCFGQVKPAVQEVVCNLKPCSADWFTGNWSSCTTSCNKGTKSRLVECRRRISPTLIPSVSADLCIDKPKPQRIRSCQLTPCIRWSVGNWTKCSTECGHGQRSREVTCIDGEGIKVLDNNCTGPKPKVKEICDMGSCVKGWYHSRWSEECSRTCGKGYRTRNIFCASDDGQHLSNKKCSPAEKPSTRKSCKNKKSCGGFWFIGPWSQCNATCGYSVKTRGVVCMRELRIGVYTTTNPEKCLQEKPPTEEICPDLPQCKPIWYMTKWSKCSKSCDTGVKKREVKCLNADLQPDMTCDKSRRPSRRHSCNKESCEIASFDLQRDASGTVCKDLYNQWCGFVRQARICSYKYYKDLCCKSCSILT